ncbi:MAG TPA: MarR family winged helix-turn-helix transcriptional regulator [Mycobacterium sp.]
MNSAAVPNHYETAGEADIASHPGLGADLLAEIERLYRFASHRTHASLPPAQARMLATIEAHGQVRLAALAAVDHCSQPTTSYQVQRLEDARLVTKDLDPDDGRAVRISITPKGIRVLNAVRAEHAALIEPQLAMLAAADRKVLADAVDVLGRLLEGTATPH